MRWKKRDVFLILQIRTCDDVDKRRPSAGRETLMISTDMSCNWFHIP